MLTPFATKSLNLISKSYHIKMSLTIKNLYMLKIQIRIITHIIPLKSLSTISLLILELILRPNALPRIPHKIIAINYNDGTDGTVFVKIVMTKLEICESKIIYKEFWAATLVSIEKKKYKTTKLIGPPPIPRKEDITPNDIPINRQTILLLNFNV